MLFVYQRNNDLKHTSKSTSEWQETRLCSKTHQYELITIILQVDQNSITVMEKTDWAIDVPLQQLCILTAIAALHHYGIVFPPPPPSLDVLIFPGGQGKQVNIVTKNTWRMFFFFFGRGVRYWSTGGHNESLNQKWPYHTSYAAIILLCKF